MNLLPARLSPAAVCRCRAALIVCAAAVLASPQLQGQLLEQQAPTHNQARAGLPAVSLAQQGFERPLSFEPIGVDLTAGQPGASRVSARDTRFVARAPGYAVLLAPSRARVQLPSGGAIDFKFIGSKGGAAIRGAEPLQAKHSYFPSGDGRGWVTQVPMFGRVEYDGLYPGVDASFYASSGRMEYDLVLRPGADPGVVKIALAGAEQARVDENGDLYLRAHGSEIRLLKPVAYQQDPNGKDKRAVPVHYSLRPARGQTGTLLSFAVGEYDRTRTLTIDPVLIAGGSMPGLFPGQDSSSSYQDTILTAISLDGAGNIYVAEQAAYNNAAFGVLKFSPSGQLLLDVSLGAADTLAQPSSLAVDSAGDIYVAGTAGVGLPTTPGAYQTTALNSETSFLTVIKADGSGLMYSTFLGGGGQSGIVGLAVDSAGRAYVAGTAYGSDFPTTAKAYQTGSAVSYGINGFVAKVDPTLSGAASLVYSTYLAGQAANSSNSATGGFLAVDKSGSAYVALTSSLGFPVTSGAYAFNGLDSSGAYIAKLSADGSALLYSAFLGPGSPGAIAVDGSGAAYIAGTVASAEFPTTPGAYQTKYPGGFAAKLSADGSSLLYSTFLSGPGGNSYNTTPNAIALQANCASACVAIVAGLESSPDWPLKNAIQSFRDNLSPAQEPYSFKTGFLTGLSADGTSALLSTYLGAATTQTYSVGGLAIDSSNNIYFAANVVGADAPVTLPIPQGAGAGYLLKIGLATAGSAVAVPAHFEVPAAQAVSSTGKTAGAIQLRNMGSQAITLQRPFVSGSKEFAESDNCGSTLAGGAICMLDISFTPSAGGVRTGNLTIESSAPNSPTVVSLSGTGVHAPELTISSATLSFAEQVVGSASVAQTLTLTNSGDQAQSIVSIASSLPDFKAAGNCPAQLAAHADCAVSVTFSPTQVGLRAGTVFVQLPGSSTVNGYTYPNGDAIAVNGSGVLSAGGTGTLVLSASGLNFGSGVVGTPALSQGFAVLNTGSSPVTINAVTATTTKGGTGDFFLPSNSEGSGYLCGSSAGFGSVASYPYEIQPQGSCIILVDFNPSSAGQETGTVSVSSSAAGSPASASLSGVGLHSVQALSVEPGKLVFPPQPIGDPSAAQTLTITNGGEDSVVLDRAVASGDFGIDERSAFGSCEGATLGPLASCSLNIVFEPTAAGARPGTLTLVDSLTGTPQVFNLAGTGIAATGRLVLSSTALSFAPQTTKTTSADQELMVTNPGNSPVTINSVTASSDFANDSSFYQGCTGALAPEASCTIDVAFSPTQSTGKENGTLTLHSTAGLLTVALSGIAEAAKQAIQVTANSLNLGSVIVGASGGAASSVTAFVENTGNEATTFLAPPVITAQVAAEASDFTFSGCYPYVPSSAGQSGYPLPAGQSCSFSVGFTPSRQGKESATLTFADSSGTHTVALSGTGVAVSPATLFSPATLSFDQAVAGAPASPFFNPGSTISFVNNTSQPIVAASISVTAGSSDFSFNQQFFSCTGQTVYPGSSCTLFVLFAPAKAGYRTGTLTLVDGNGVRYSATLAGYGLKQVAQTSLSPEALLLPTLSLASGSTYSYGTNATVQLQNTGNAALTVGSLSETNVSAAGDFSVSYPGGQDNCSGTTVQPQASCQVTVAFTPKGVGKRTGTLVFPVTYADKSTASFTEVVSGVALANQDASYLLPQTLDFSNLVVGTQSGYYATQLTLMNSGTVALTPGAVSGTNLNLSGAGEQDFTLGYNNCSSQLVAPGATCNLGITYTPAVKGQRSGTVTLPVTYADGSTDTLTVTLAGDAIVPAPALLVTPSSLQFNVEVAGTASLGNTQGTVLTSAGNVPVILTSVSASPNFTVLPSGCGTSVVTGSACAESVAFTPSASTPPGRVTGTLTIVDNAPGSPHVVALAGTVVPVAQLLALSQTSVTFGDQALKSASAPQVVYLTDLDDAGSIAQINSLQLRGANAADFVETQTCGGSLGFSIHGRQSCTISIAFAPGAQSVGTRTASVAITPAAGPPLLIQLIGNGVAALKSAAVR